MADKIGSQLLGKTRVADAIQRAMKERSKRTLVTADRVLQEIARIAFADIRKTVTFGPSGVIIKSSESLDDDTAAAISEVCETTTKEGGSQKVKMHDKVKALDLAAKHLGLYEKDKQNGPVVVNYISPIGQRSPLPPEFAVKDDDEDDAGD